MEGKDSGRIVVGVSGSLNSLAALHRAAKEACLTGREVLAVMVWRPPSLTEAAQQPIISMGLTEGSRRAAVHELIVICEDAFSGVERGVSVGGLAIRGTPGPTLVKIAGGADDILVVGTGRRGTLRHRSMSTVARYCVRHASCPVLTVPPSPLQSDLEAVSRRRCLRLNTREWDVPDVIGFPQ